MRIAIVSDAWYPQTNGVVTTLTHTIECLRAAGHTVEVLGPDSFATVPCPSYPEIRVALWPWRRVAALIEQFVPDRIHIATEGPLGLAARAYCVRRAIPFTTSYHTQYPEYVRARYPIPLEAGYAYMRWFHGAAVRTLVTTPTMRQQLEARGLTNLTLWTRGVDLMQFRPRGKDYFDLPRPIMLFAGRVAIEKNLDAFLSLRLSGSKVVVGDGPQLHTLKQRHQTVVFTGYKFGDELVRAIAAADVFVFPSVTDTFGLVMLEAMACGVPVAAFPAAAPRHVVEPGVSGAINADLSVAIRAALALSPTICRRYAERFTWSRSARQFADALVPVSRQLPLGRASREVFEA